MSTFQVSANCSLRAEPSPTISVAKKRWIRVSSVKNDHYPRNAYILADPAESRLERAVSWMRRNFRPWAEGVALRMGWLAAGAAWGATLWSLI